MKLIAINGLGSSGKDTFVNMFKTIAPNTVYIESILPVKNAATLLGWKGKKTETDREFLADIKAAWIQYNNGAIKYILEQINKPENKDKYIFVSVREPEQLEQLRKFGFKFLLIRRDCTASDKDLDKNLGVFEFNYDYVTNNDDSLANLMQKVIYFKNKIDDTANPNIIYHLTLHL